MAVPGVRLGVGEDAVGARADQAGRHGQRRDLQDHAVAAAGLAVLAGGDPQRDQHASDDADGVGAYRQRAQVPYRPGWAREEGGRHVD
jgi:hypothetical protein